MRAKLVEKIDFERKIHPKDALGIGGISLGKARHEAKLRAIQDWITWLNQTLVDKTISAKARHIYTNTEDGMEYDGEDKWENVSINVKDIINSDDPWDDHSIMVIADDRKVWAIPIDDKKIFIEGPVNENQNFERGINEPSDLGLGKWKEGEDITVPIYDFEKNGGILEKDREIWSSRSTIDRLQGYYLGYDPEQNVHLMYNSQYKSTPIPPGYGVRLKTKVLYK